MRTPPPPSVEAAPEAAPTEPTFGRQHESLLAALSVMKERDVDGATVDSGESKTPQLPTVPPSSPDPHSPQPEPPDDHATDTSEESPSAFPVAAAGALAEMLERSQWVVPVMRNQELEVLIDAAIVAAKEGRVEGPVAAFVSDSLFLSMERLMTNSAVMEWKHEIQLMILGLTKKVVELAALLMDKDEVNESLLANLAHIFDPNARFHSHNKSQSLPEGEDASPSEFATTRAEFSARAWLAALVRHFGRVGGFQALADRAAARPLDAPLALRLLRPFANCAEFLETGAVLRFLLGPLDAAIALVDAVSDEELKKESSPKERASAQPVAVASQLAAVAVTLGARSASARTLEAAQTARLRLLLRVVSLATFSNRMSALKDLNAALSVPDDGGRAKGLSSEETAAWLIDNDLVSIVLKANLHQPQYVDRVESLFKALAKNGAVSPSAVDAVWAAASGSQHDVIRVNVQRLLARLAPALPPPALARLFARLGEDWVTADDKEREKLLSLLRLIVNEDERAVLSAQTLALLWSLARDHTMPVHLLYEAALPTHLRVLEIAYLSDPSPNSIMEWMRRCVAVLDNPEEQYWVVPALQHTQSLASLLPTSEMVGPRPERMSVRRAAVHNLQQSANLVGGTINNLAEYQKMVRNMCPLGAVSPGAWSPVFGSRSGSHLGEIQRRLEFVKFLLKEGGFWLADAQAAQLWQELIVGANFLEEERRLGFGFFAELLENLSEPDVNPENATSFFEDHVLQLEPGLLDEAGLECFTRFLLFLNSREDRLSLQSSDASEPPLLLSMDLIGEDYLWRIILDAPDKVSEGAIALFKRIYCNPSPKLRERRLELHGQIIDHSFNKLRGHYDTLDYLWKSSRDAVAEKEMGGRGEKMSRVLRTLHAYIAACDAQFQGERRRVPLGRASLGAPVRLELRFASQLARDPLVFKTHGNATLRQLRPLFAKGTGLANFCLSRDVDGELCELFDTAAESATLDDLGLVVCPAIILRPVPRDSPLESSGEEEDDSNPQAPRRAAVGNSEDMLPGNQMAAKAKQVGLVLRIGDLAERLDMDELRGAAAALLDAIPACDSMEAELLSVCRDLEAPVDDRSARLRALFIRDSGATSAYCLQLAEALALPAAATGASAGTAAGLWAATGPDFWLSLEAAPDFLSEAAEECKAAASRRISRLSAFALGLQTTLASRGDGDWERLRQLLLRVVPDPTLRPDWTAQLRAAAEFAVAHLPLPESPALVSPVVVERLWSKVLFALGEEGGSAEELGDVLDALALGLSLCPGALTDLTDDDTTLADALRELLLKGLGHADLTKRILFINFVRVLADTWMGGLGNAALGRRFLRVLMPLLPPTLDGQPGDDCVFGLLCRLLHLCRDNELDMPEAEPWLAEQLAWLDWATTTCGEAFEPEEVLAGRLLLSAELVHFLSPEARAALGPPSGMLLQNLVDNFLFSPSLRLQEASQPPSASPSSAPKRSVGLCGGRESRTAAFELLVALCVGEKGNIGALVHAVTTIFYSDEGLGLSGQSLCDWDLCPSGDLRGASPFVGLKNAGATCYINSVLQQLFMIEPLRQAILNADTSSVADEEETDIVYGSVEAVPSKEREAEYPVRLLKCLQTTFAHLSASAEAWYSPRLLWRTFRWSAGGPAIRVREQQDALEFLGSLLDCLERAFKALAAPAPLPTAAFQGAFADQKICRTCPHRYERSEPFETLAVDVRGRSSLQESLSEYVRGDLLEGDNAYFCAKCEAKVAAVKRLCVKALPQLLAIQLKRFDFDYERNIPVKFNDYFHFPRRLDMEPYTASGLARQEEESPAPPTPEEYELRGVVVHSGVQASSGHYYSYIRVSDASAEDKWFKFDDTDVTEVDFSDEELSLQCFGGDCEEGERGRFLSRRKRWWNAYILLYERRVEGVAELSTHLSAASLRPTLPPLLEAMVQEKNMALLHERALMSSEFGDFVLVLAQQNYDALKRGPAEAALALGGQSLRLAVEYLLGTGLRLATPLGHADAWISVLRSHLRLGPSLRRWLLTQLVSRAGGRVLPAFLLDSPNAWVRDTMGSIVVELFRVGWADALNETQTLGGVLLRALMGLLGDWRGSTRSFAALLAVFRDLAKAEAGIVALCWAGGLGDLLRRLVCEELSVRADLSELRGAYAALSTLIRSTAVPSRRLLPPPVAEALPNRFGISASPVLVMPPEMEGAIYADDCRLLRRFVENAADLEETKHLLEYLGWENLSLSLRLLTTVIPRALSQAYNQRDMRPLRDLMESQLRLNDSHREARIRVFLEGEPVVPGDDDSVGQDSDWDGVLRFVARVWAPAPPADAHGRHFEERSTGGRKCAVVLDLVFALLEREPAARALVEASSALRDLAALAVRWLRSAQAQRSNYYYANEAFAETERRAETALIQRADRIMERLGPVVAAGPPPPPPATPPPDPTPPAWIPPDAVPAPAAPAQPPPPYEPPGP